MSTFDDLDWRTRERMLLGEESRITERNERIMRVAVWVAALAVETVLLLALAGWILG